MAEKKRKIRRPTTRQHAAGRARSGLGLGSAAHHVKNYLNGGDWQIVAEQTDVERGPANSTGPSWTRRWRCAVHQASW